MVWRYHPAHREFEIFNPRVGVTPFRQVFANVIFDGARELGIVLAGYTLISLVGMAWYGKHRWRTHGEVFSVWFGLLGRLAPEISSQPRSWRGGSCRSMRRSISSSK